jgi:hypothetical protein
VLKVGDRVRPRPEWRRDPVPTGRVKRTGAPWRPDVLYVGNERRGFCEYVFELDEE